MGSGDEHDELDAPLLDGYGSISAGEDPAVPAHPGPTPPPELGGSLAPIPPIGWSWTGWSYTAMWLSISIQPSGFILGASLLGMGLSWGEAAVAVTVGNLILSVPLLLNALPGLKYRISFPVLCRASFGLHGAVVAALSRGLVAIGWLSFNMWLAAKALFFVGTAVSPGLNRSMALSEDINVAELAAFGVVLAIHVGLLFAGMARRVGRSALETPLKPHRARRLGVEVTVR